MTKKYISLEHHIRNIVEGKTENNIDVDSIVESVMEEASLQEFAGEIQLDPDWPTGRNNYMVFPGGGSPRGRPKRTADPRPVSRPAIQPAPGPLRPPQRTPALLPRPARPEVPLIPLVPVLPMVPNPDIVPNSTPQAEPAAEPQADPVVVPTPQTNTQTQTDKKSEEKKENQKKRILPMGLGAGTPSPATDSVAASPSDLSKYMHMAKPYVRREQVKEDATEERSKIENVARPNSRRDRAVKQQEIQKKIIEEKKSLAQVVKKNIEDTRKEKKNSTVIINPTLNKPETGGY